MTKMSKTTKSAFTAVAVLAMAVVGLAPASAMQTPIGNPYQPGPPPMLVWSDTLAYPPSHAEGPLNASWTVPQGYASLEISYQLVGDCPESNATAAPGFVLTDPVHLTNHVLFDGAMNYSCTGGQFVSAPENLSFPGLAGTWTLQTMGSFGGVAHFSVVADMGASNQLPAAQQPSPDPYVHRSMDFQVNPDSLLQSIDSAGHVSLLLGDVGTQQFALADSDANHTVSVIELDTAGNEISSHPVTARSFTGSLSSDSASRAALTIDANGVYGVVDHAGITYNYQPLSDRAPDNGSLPWVRVEWVLRPTSGPATGVVNSVMSILRMKLPFSLLAAATSGGGSGSAASTGGSSGSGSSSSTSTANTNTASCGGPYQTMATANIAAYADKSFRNRQSDYSTRISNALNAESWMWGCYAAISTSLYAVYAPANDYSTSTACQDQLASFHSVHSSISGIAAYQLFTGVNIISSCTGQGYTSGAGYRSTTPDSVLEAVETNTGDYYNPNLSSHLGAVSGQELAHNWGEPDHPLNYDSSAGKYNIMAGGGSRNWNDIGFWLTGGSSQWSANRIMSAWGIYRCC